MRKLIQDLKNFSLPFLFCFFLVGIFYSLAANSASWFTGHTYQGNTQPLSSFAKDPSSGDISPRASLPPLQNCGNDSYCIDLVVVLESNPQGDERKVWVEMMEHFADAIYEATNGGHKLRFIRIFRDSILRT